MTHDDFLEVLWHKASELYRDMPWRTDTRPYYVLVSELMLQQTQVGRVIPKFHDFIEAFPDVTTLAEADLSDVLTQWQGLGYNRRAKYLHETAKKIVTDFNGVFPESDSDLMSLPGVGVNTAGAIASYAFNRPSIFIETNVRTVYIHHFFSDDFAVDDKRIIDELTATLDHEHPREFYWALMDYGSWLKTNGVRNIAQSKHYKKQSALQGSVREVRGLIVRRLTTGPAAEHELRDILAADERFPVALGGLIKDGLVTRSGELIQLTK